MTKVRLDISEDEMRDLLTKLWHASGYDIDKKDPVIIEYMMHKIILEQYEEHLLAQTKYFLGEFLPYLNEANAKFESKKVEFMDHAEKKQKEVLASMTEAHSKHVTQVAGQINKTTTDACQRILDNLKIMITHLYDQEETLLTRIDQKHTSLKATAALFEKHLRRGAYIVAGSAILVFLSLGVCACLYLWR